VNTPQLDEVTIYTDGASSGNPGPGGYGTVLLCRNHRKELSGGFKKTTNNRMELLAVITGLKALKHRCRVTIVSDSKYVVDAVEKKWIEKWKSFGWRRNQKEILINPDLWKQLGELLETHEVRFKWVPGHRGYRENERCDELAVAAAQKPHLPPDPGFEAQSSSSNGMFDI
jgi:ribonuclease HI